MSVSIDSLSCICQTHQDALNFVTIQALQLDIFPERAKNQFLEIDLEYASDQSRDKFIIKSGRIVVVIVEELRIERDCATVLCCVSKIHEFKDPRKKR